MLDSYPANGVTRRGLLLGGAAAAAAGLHGTFAPETHAQSGRRPRRAIRIAHLTDIHVQPERNAERGFAACLHHVQSMKDAPQLILTGGDSVMDVMSKTSARAAVVGKSWRQTLQNECSLPVRSCIGNHDVWGWSKESSETTGSEPNWGKSFAEDLLGLNKRYYAFDQAGWRFVMLDSTYPSGSSYTAKLDDEQFQWLEQTLRETPATTPVLVLSHIPIISAAAFFDGDNEESGNWAVPGAWMHIDARRIKDLFLNHPNVKLCLSGHLHLCDQVLYNGVGYCCNGAVCGGWWDGNHQECEPGYAIVDLFRDGTYTNRYVPFGWKS